MLREYYNDSVGIGLRRRKENGESCPQELGLNPRPRSSTYERESIYTSRISARSIKGINNAL